MSEQAFQSQLRQVALERVQKIRRHLARGPAAGAGEQDERIADAMREAHTLKGEARITGRGDIATLAHRLEEALETGAAQAAEQLLVTLEQAVSDSARPAHEVSPGGLDLASGLEQTLLRVELAQVSELTRACSELRAVQHSMDGLARDLASLAARPPQSPAERMRAVRDIARRSSELAFELDQRTEVLERDLRDLRMLPIARLFEPLAHAAKQVANDLNKPLEVQLEGGSAYVDRQVLDQMSEPLLHLVRNAVDHGLESIDARERAGKRAVGTLRLSAEQSGRSVRLQVEDDGRGIDLSAVRRALVERGEWTQDTAVSAAREAVLAQLFEPGFSTRAQVSQVSGRGLGLDIVRRRAEALGGGVRVETEAGQGTRFVLTVPVSLVADPVVPVEVDGAVYAFATSEVTAVREMASVERARAGEAPLVRLDDRAVPMRDLGLLLGSGRGASRDALVVVRSDASEVAFAVDRLLPVAAAVRQGLDPFLDGMQVVRATVSLAGQLVTLLDGRELLRRADRTTPSVAPAALSPERRLRVLVVDDSELTRDVLVATLEGLGYEVQEAVNGMRALEAITCTRFDLVLTDIDMPVMDGLELLERIRAGAKTERLPVIVLTTRAGGSYLERASELGADAYLIKASFQTHELARLVHLHAAGAA